VKLMVSADTRMLAKGLDVAMGYSKAAIQEMQGCDLMKAILDEWNQALDDGFATNLDIECVEYVYREKAGSNSRKWQHNGLVMDHNEDGSKSMYARCGFTLDDIIMKDEDVVKYNLQKWHVFVLRLYSTAAYWTINSNMRKRTAITAQEAQELLGQMSREAKYPFPLTLLTLKDALLKLREKHIDTGEDTEMDLFRGMKDVKLPEEFIRKGGCEFAPCSTTTDVMVALQYSKSDHPIILKVRSKGFHDRGADISFLSVFQSEKEILYPPLTMFRPTKDRKGRIRRAEIGNCEFVEIEATLPS